MTDLKTDRQYLPITPPGIKMGGFDLALKAIKYGYKYNGDPKPQLPRLP